ncbi:uncharacterized protein sS8_0858 [Methylocaldum marinum]|uniref:DUF3800 domain-containing protein n=1 Tax=Methylocaldum marinum TaxID=1432792 RepID=A0A250KMA3_9GAMM|nr:DUF3800 domain-containing protein [Methylocaldum marinum]BBA32823.1 uncharacterized protein sS8_0858 [Methylocaldum marinum]
MYFYVDESGHTGTNLFDENQPILYYGVLSSRVNIDVLAENTLSSLRKRLGVKRLHANELGNAGIAQISTEIYNLQKRYDLRFDIYRVAKADHALISFFDQVFDQGLNPAITWSGYWTPMRYVLLLKLAYLFDEETLKKAWSARIEINDQKAESGLVEVCNIIKGRVGELPDERSRTLIYDTLNWADNNPAEIYYNAKRKKDMLSITPNLIGFQSVMHGITLRLLKNGKKASQITVDQQSQFNKAQKTLAEFYASARDVPMVTGPGLPEISFKGMPTIPISFKAGTESAGLELVDVYLWIFKRLMEEKELAPKIYPIIQKQMHKSRTDEISIHAIASRWQKWFEDLPEPTEEQMKKGRELMALDEKRRLEGMTVSAQQGVPADAEKRRG